MVHFILHDVIEFFLKILKGEKKTIKFECFSQKFFVKKKTVQS